MSFDILGNKYSFRDICEIAFCKNFKSINVRNAQIIAFVCSVVSAIILFTNGFFNFNMNILVESVIATIMIVLIYLVIYLIFASIKARNVENFIKANFPTYFGNKNYDVLVEAYKKCKRNAEDDDNLSSVLNTYYILIKNS